MLESKRILRAEREVADKATLEALNIGEYIIFAMGKENQSSLGDEPVL